MASATFFFVAASADRRLHASYAKDLEVAMFSLGERPIRAGDDLVLFDRLVYFEEFPTVRAAAKMLKRFGRMSPPRQALFVSKLNPDWNDYSARWFPIPAATTLTLTDLLEFPGESPGGVGARLEPNIPPRAASDEVDPITVMPFEDQLASGAYQRLFVGTAAPGRS